MLKPANSNSSPSASNSQPIGFRGRRAATSAPTPAQVRNTAKTSRSVVPRRGPCGEKTQDSPGHEERRRERSERPGELAGSPTPHGLIVALLAPDREPP